MRKLSATIVAAALLAAPVVAMAATPEEAQYRAMGAVAGFFGVMAIIMFSIFASFVGFLIFWLLMLLDCLDREWPEKATWTAILILSLFMGLHWLSAILYYVLVKQKNPGKRPAKTA